MPIETDLTLFLLADTAITDVIDDRLFAEIRPDSGDGSALPAIVYQRIGAERNYEMTGPLEVVRPRIQLSIWARSHDERESLFELVRLRLAVHPALQIVNDLRDTEPDTGLYRALLDLAVWALEPEPA